MMESELSLSKSTEHTPLISDSSEKIKRYSSQNGPKDSSENASEVSSTGSYKYTGRQIRVLVQMALANFCHTVCFSLIAPFFPAEAEKKGATTAQIGLIFSVFELVMFLCSPIYGRYITQIGSRFLYISGLFVCGSTTILFGFLNLAPDGSVFVGLCFAVRICESIAATAFVTASFAIIANEFPGRVATVFGLLETFTGLGLMVGPPIGGVLYGIGGWLLPFEVMGGIMLICVLISLFLLPEQDDQVISSPHSFVTLLAIPTVLVSSATISSAAVTITVVEPNLEPALRQYNIGPEIVGLVFLCMSGVYTITAPFWGYLSDNYAHAKLFMSAGCLLCMMGMLLLGPSPIFFIEPGAAGLWLVILALCITGLGIGLQLVPPFKDCLVQSLAHGFPDNFETYGLVSGLFSSCFSFGAFFGPSVGGALVQAINFEWTTTIVAALHLILFSVLITFEVTQYYKRKRKRETGIVDEVESWRDSFQEVDRRKSIIGETGVHFYRQFSSSYSETSRRHNTVSGSESYA